MDQLLPSYQLSKVFERLNCLLTDSGNERGLHIRYPALLLFNLEFCTLQKMVQMFESVDEMLKCNHLNESY